ncbi:DUF6344 domain-containing protein [Streptomyces sp. NPDC003860]
MAALKVRNLWTAFLTALVALFASLGLTSAAAASGARPAAAPTPEEPARPAQDTASATGDAATGDTGDTGGAGDTAVHAEPGGTATGPSRRDRERERERERAQQAERARAVRSLLPLLLPAQHSPWHAEARERSLPPTIKQRIRAEAHGSSPSVRKLSVYDTGAEPVAPEAAAVADRSLHAGDAVTTDRTAVPAARSSFTTAA